MYTNQDQNVAPRPIFKAVLATVAACFIAVPLAVQAQTAPMPQSHSGMDPKSHAAMGKPATDKPATDMHKSMTGMNEKMAAMPMSGNPDVDFATMMRIHHVGALDMAQAQLKTGKDPVMRNMAKKIIAAQKKEIAEFDRWLAKNKN